MSPNNAANERLLLHSQVRFLRVVVVALSVVLAITLILLGLVVFRETTRIVPPEVRRPYEIGANYANRDYLSDMAEYVLDKVLTVTPASVSYNNNVILKLTHPDGYGPLKAYLDAAALRIKKEQISTIWVPRNEQVNESDKTVKISGTYKTFIADKLVSERQKEYLVQFVMTSSGRLYVSKIDEVVKSDTPASVGD